MGNVEAVPPTDNKRGLKFYVKMAVVAIVLLVAVSEVVVSQRTGTSFNMEMLDKLLNVLLALVDPASA